MTHDDIAVRLRGDLGRFRLDADFAVPARGISALFGPSGCGKTSILRSVAGLNRIPGMIRIGAELWQDDRIFVPTHRRAIGYVFQEPSLFSHLSVRRNLQYGASRSRAVDAHVRFDEVVDLLGLARLVERSPEHLSGGERQRVAIGRALLSRPRLLLMDEPLSALDRMARDEILPYFEALHANLKIPILLVTHDIGEVERLADHLVLLHDGAVMAAGRLDEVLTAPQSPLAGRRDVAAVLPGQVARMEPDGIGVVDVRGVEILVLAGSLRPGEAIRLRIAAGDVSIATRLNGDSSILNALPARITAIDPLGDAEATVMLDIGRITPALIRARLTRRSLARLDLKVGQAVIAQMKSVSIAANR